MLGVRVRTRIRFKLELSLGLELGLDLGLGLGGVRDHTRIKSTSWLGLSCQS